MLLLLLWVLILGVIAWGISALPIAQPFKTVAWCILIIILIVILFQAFGGLNLSVPRVR